MDVPNWIFMIPILGRYDTAKWRHDASIFLMNVLIWLGLCIMKGERKKTGESCC